MSARDKISWGLRINRSCWFVSSPYPANPYIWIRIYPNPNISEPVSCSPYPDSAGHSLSRATHPPQICLRWERGHQMPKWCRPQKWVITLTNVVHTQNSGEVKKKKISNNKISLLYGGHLLIFCTSPFPQCLFFSPNTQTTTCCVILERVHFDREWGKNLK